MFYSTENESVQATSKEENSIHSFVSRRLSAELTSEENNESIEQQRVDDRVTDTVTGAESQASQSLVEAQNAPNNSMVSVNVAPPVSVASEDKSGDEKMENGESESVQGATTVAAASHEATENTWDTNTTNSNTQEQTTATIAVSMSNLDTSLMTVSSEQPPVADVVANVADTGKSSYK